MVRAKRNPDGSTSLQVDTDGDGTAEKVIKQDRKGNVLDEKPVAGKTAEPETEDDDESLVAAEADAGSGGDDEGGSLWIPLLAIALLLTGGGLAFWRARRGRTPGNLS